jgi:UV excision repair protein RAD23
MKITIKSLKQLTYDVELTDTATVEQLKKLVEEKHGFDSTNMKLLYSGIILDDKKTLLEYNMKEPNSYIVTMLNYKIKPKNLEKVEEKPIEKVNSEPIVNNKDIGNKSNTSSVPKLNAEKIPNDYNSQVNQLVDMGFPKDLATNALNASNGDIPTAIEFLYCGIPTQNKANPMLSEFMEENEDEEGEGQVELNQEAIKNIDLNDPNALKNISSVLKVIISEDPDQLQNLLEDIEEINPDIIEHIKKNETEFKNLISVPITSEDLLAFNQIMGGKDEEAYDEDELVDEGIHNVLQDAGNFDNSAGIIPTVNFTQTEKESIERIKALGFSEIDVVQAFIACDKNEEITANFLFENKYKEDDMNIDCMNFYFKILDDESSHSHN